MLCAAASRDSALGLAVPPRLITGDGVSASNKLGLVYLVAAPILVGEGGFVVACVAG